MLKSNYTTYTTPLFRHLSDSQLEELYLASLEILERTGARFYEEEAVELFKKAGALVSEGNRVRIPAGLVEWAMSIAPKRVRLCDRHGQPVMQLEDHKVFFGTGSDCLHVLDHRTGERRKAKLQDVVEGITLCDALPNIDYVMSMFLPWDAPLQDLYDRYQMEIMLNYTTKPIVFVTAEFEGCVDCVEMAEAVMGGPEALRQSPLVTCYINVTTALRHNKEAVQKLLYLARKDLPSLYVPVVSGGTTAPVTLAGNLALSNAGHLAGLVLSQLAREGAPYIIGGWTGNTLDMRTLVDPYVVPEKSGLGNELAHYQRLPVFGLSGCTDAKELDQQAAAEAALTILIDALSGSNLVHDLGYLESGLTGSLEALVICDEIVDWVKAFMKGVEINQETLALDLIDEVGPDGQFMDTEHTLNHFRESWYPRLFDRKNYDDWAADGSKTLRDRAREKVEEVLASHEPEPLPKDVAEKVKAIVRRAEEGQK